MSGFYAAATAIHASQQREQAIAQNLANLQTAGYKRAVVAMGSFDEALQATGETGPTALVSARGGIDFSQGELFATGQPLDMALDGEGFFAVETEAGVRYTRSGVFRLDGQGTLVNLAGHRVLGSDGPISLGEVETAGLQVDALGRLQTPAGGSHQLQVVAFDGRPPLIPEGAGLYRAESPPGPADPDRVSVRQGYLERSNADAISELMGLIEVHRSLEAATKSIEAAMRTLERTTTELR